MDHYISHREGISVDSAQRFASAFLLILGAVPASASVTPSQSVPEVSGTLSGLNPPITAPFSLSTAPFTFAGATITGMQNFVFTIRGVTNSTGSNVTAQVYLSAGVTQPDATHYLLDASRMPVGACFLRVNPGANQTIASECRMSEAENAALRNAGIVNIYSTTQNLFLGLGPEAAPLVFAGGASVSLTLTPAPLPALQLYMSAGGGAPSQQTYNLPPFTSTPTVTTSTTLGGTWLSATLGTTITGPALTVNISPSGLAPAVYTGNVMLATAGQTTVPVPVTFAVQPSTLQYVQQGGKLYVGTPVPTGGVEQGYSVSVTQDGNTLLTGSPEDQSGDSNGNVWLYQRSAGVWNLANNYYDVGIGQSGEGRSVAISADGTTVLWGAPFDNSSVGAAWVTGGACTPAKLVGTGAIGTANQGISVALSADGLTALVGGEDDNNNVGAAWVFFCSQGTWQQQARLVGAGASSFTYHGYRVALSADGNTALVGRDQVSNTPGDTWVFTHSGGVWTQQATLTANPTSMLGTSIGVTADGNTALIGAGGDYAGWVFQRSGTQWTRGAEMPSNASSGGDTVALSADGSTAAVSGQNGAVIYRNSNQAWSQLGPLLTPNDGPGNWHPNTMAFSDDGSTLIAGFAHDISRVGGTWAFVPSFLPPNLISISPDAGTAGVGFNLTATGTFFMKGATIQVNGTNLPATLVSPTQLTAAVPAEVTTSIANVPVVVINPDGSSSSSDSLLFTQPALNIASTHTGNFIRSRKALYQITVSNPNVSIGSTPGVAITVIDELPANLTAVSISGQGWTCTLSSVSCVRSDVLVANSSYPPIQVVVNVGSGGSSSPSNIVLAQGGGFAIGSGVDATNLVTATRCDINGDQAFDITDLQLIVNQALGQSLAADDLNADGKVNVADIQTIVRGLMPGGGTCGT